MIGGYEERGEASGLPRPYLAKERSGKGPGGGNEALGISGRLAGCRALAAGLAIRSGHFFGG